MGGHQRSKMELEWDNITILNYGLKEAIAVDADHKVAMLTQRSHKHLTLASIAN